MQKGEKQTSRRKNMMTANTANMQNSLHVCLFPFEKIKSKRIDIKICGAHKKKIYMLMKYMSKHKYGGLHLVFMCETLMFEDTDV